MGSTADTLKNMIKKIQDKARCDCPGSTDIDIELKPYQWEYVIKALEMALVWEADDKTEVESYNNLTGENEEQVPHVLEQIQWNVEEDFMDLVRQGEIKVGKSNE